MIDRRPWPKSRSRARGSLPSLSLPAEARLSSQWFHLGAALLGIAFLTFVLYLYVVPNSEISAARVRIAQLKAERDSIYRQNSELLREIAQQSELSALRPRAAQLGMGPPQSAVYLKMPADLRSATRAPQPDAAATVSGPLPLPEVPDPGAWFESLDLGGRWEAVRSAVAEAIDQVLARLR